MADRPSRILRVQDDRGRGPWRPGFSAGWVDSWRTECLPQVYQEIPDFAAIVARAKRDGMHVGCAARGMAGLLAWFSPMELCRLDDLGFQIVDASGCDVLAETPHQLIIGSNRPLRELPSVLKGEANA